VDMETGKVEIIKGVGSFDVGKAINPEMVKAQMEGGFVQGMSTAFFEALKFKNGVVQNPSFVDYRIATSSDVPDRLESIIVEVPQDDGPYGARGVGEHSMVPTIPAIANAIFDATGVRVFDPPYSAEKVYLALLDAGVVK
jgi:CO/xanthine dehydrogenase Mo-binding subunit